MVSQKDGIAVSLSLNVSVAKVVQAWQSSPLFLASVLLSRLGCYLDSRLERGLKRQLVLWRGNRRRVRGLPGTEQPGERVAR